MSLTPLHKGKHTLTANAEQLMRYPEIFFWGAEKRLLNIVENYLKLPVAYDSLSYYYSIADGKDLGPRKWHRDKEDWKMVKIGIYLNDVDEYGGPFECVYPEINKFLHQTVQPKYRVMKHQELQQHLPDPKSNWFTSCTGSAGTVVFVDTAMYYHRGKPPIAMDRAALFFGYFSRRPKNPYFCGRSPLSRNQLHYLSEFLPPDLYDYVNWKDSLPGIGRWIPKNRLKV
ncbi:hypothetical protein V2H45_01565 [Tumidithrix elongata RA019]|uniref:Phytanoyl-CoA dioxygenase n=1 Tax=Tumidithrix elongata BACA0141 TaxID=2716417 RepID=A0AAW9PTS9_9CYAN|nr:hypothetical protein [Tumidithrix elongata RA019]